MNPGTPWRCRLFAVATVALSLSGCASAPTPRPGQTNTPPLAGEDALEARVTELVQEGLRKRKLKADIVLAETPYIRYNGADGKVVVELVEGAFATACREYGGVRDDRGTYRSLVLSQRHFDGKRTDSPMWPTASTDTTNMENRLNLLMDTASEVGAHETGAYLDSVCLLKNEREAIISAYEDRPGQTVFDRVRPDVTKFYANPDLRRYYWFSVGSFNRYAARVPDIREERQRRATAMYESVRPQTQALVAADVAVVRKTEQRAAQARAARVEVDNAAAVRFSAAVAAEKPVGSTVCSADNRVAYIEQVAGTRIKLTVRGRALGTYAEFGKFGPHSLMSAPEQYATQGTPQQIEDANFLFHPLPRSVRLSSEPQVIWDESRFWGACDYR
jgi:hypothetical protein